ncbi:MAG: phenylacetate--CoA ligase family protein [Oscillospiraceae bacterium]|nr:phenylacetate--CoA ligase family protein [Oscillospiraceae bacterium]
MGLFSEMVKTHSAGKMTPGQTESLQKQKLRKLVSYARDNSPFYKRLYSGVGEDFDLSDLPAVDKSTIMANFDSVLTDRDINMRRIEEFTADNENIGRMIDGKYLVFKTSGSTGIPAVVLYDKRSIDVSSAVAALRTFARDEDLKSFMKHGKKTAGVFADHGFYLACGMSRYMQLKMPHKKTKITVDVNAPEEQIVKELNAFRPAMLSGYPSNLALLADIKELDITPDVVITGGELLTDDIRKKLQDKFGCYVQTHYSCTEGGELACECSEGHLHINEDIVILEPVDSENRPVGYGVQSDKVLMTNLSNFIQPFIRYEITDRVVIHDEPCRCGRSSRWIEIEGRTDDILVFENGVKIAPMSLYKILEEIKPIRRFQLVHIAPESLELRLISDDPEGAFEQAKRELLTFFQEKGLTGINITFSEKIPQAHKVSGKFKHIYTDFNTGK